MVLKVVVVLVVLALLARRFLPRHKVAWYAPLVVGTTVVVVRALTYVYADPSP